MNTFSKHTLIDTHCHFNFDDPSKAKEETKGIDLLIQEAEDVGIGAFINISTEMSSLPLVASISDRYSQVFHTVGVHPHDTSSMTLADLPILQKAAKHPQCKAIGEIGLDYYFPNTQVEIQKIRLEWQLNLAAEVGLPVVIHSRNAETDLLEALTRYSQKTPTRSFPGVIHCFSGTLDFGAACLNLGFYLSFSGILTFKKAHEVQEAARIFPLERMLLETDSPFLAPVPFRGKKCEPSMMIETAKKLAEIKQLPLDTVIDQTTKNAIEVFSLPFLFNSPDQETLKNSLCF